MGSSVKGLTKVQVDEIHSLSLLYSLAVEGDQVCQAGPAFPEPMLARPDPPVVLHMPGECTQDELLHNLAWHRGQADRPVVLIS